MPRYFFHIVHQDGWVRDHEGTELADLGRAYTHAAFFLEHVAGYFDEHSDWRGWLINVTDTNGSSPLTVLFPAATNKPASSLQQGSPQTTPL